MEIYGKNCRPLVINNSIDIHDETDVMLARYMVAKYY